MAAAVELLNNDLARRDDGADTSSYSLECAALARSFHSSIPGYAPTPLRRLPELASSAGISVAWVKDESARFGLNAFKGLGASYAIGRVLADKLARDIADTTFADLTSDSAKEALGDLVFATATDGNHGRGVAWAAQQLGQSAAIFLPSHAASFRVERIRGHGAAVTVTDTNYDETVRIVAAAAEQHGWLLIQDTAWPGYEDVPVWIMHGYLTMFSEALDQLEGQTPTHVFIQAGVGSLAGALQGYLVERYGAQRPLLTVVEPRPMASYYLSVEVNDGQSHTITGAHDKTIMACLAAGENSPLAWPVLRDYADFFVRCADEVTELGMRSLAFPGDGIPSVIAGESGAVTTGVLASAGDDEQLFEKLHLDSGSRVLLFSTEGAGDPADYKSIVGFDPP